MDQLGIKGQTNLLINTSRFLVFCISFCYVPTLVFLFLIVKCPCNFLLNNTKQPISITSIVLITLIPENEYPAQLNIGMYTVYKTNEYAPDLKINYQVKNDLQRAEEYYSRAILADPSDGETLSKYASLIWELHHDEERANSYFQQAVQASPDNRYHTAVSFAN